MLGRRSPQRELFRPDHLLIDHVGRDSFFGFLATKGPELFPDDSFKDLYPSKRGRPSVPPSQLSILLLLQNREGCSDAEAISRTAFDLRWKVALGLELEEKLCAKSTLQLFRSKLVLHEAFGRIFERSVEACRAAGLLGRRKLEVAIDTTPILGRGAVKDTFNLVSEQIRVVVEAVCQLKEWTLEEVVAEQGLTRHFGSSFKGSVEIDWSNADEKRALVGQLVSDAQVALELAKRALRGYRKSAEPTRSLREACSLLSELLLQDIDEAPSDEGGPTIRRGTVKGRIVSRTDPQMRRGNKSHSQPFNGYKASVVADTKEGVILATDVRAGNVSDKERAIELVDEAGCAAGQEIERALGDTAYGSVATRADFAERGIELIAKAPPVPSRTEYSHEAFRIDESRGVAHCPAGKQSIRRSRTRSGPPGHTYHFSRNDCSGCPHRSRCTTSKIRARTITITESTKALGVHRKRQKTKGFRRIYRRRVRVEHAIGRLRQLGIRQARYIGPTKIAFQVALLASVANLCKAALAGPCRALATVCRAMKPLWSF